MIERGKIKYTQRKQQINNFEGLLYGRITPTDLDGLIEYHNKAYILLEVKYKDAELPFGQRLAIERLIKDTAAAGKKSMAIVAEHNIEDTNQQVDVADCMVREIYLYSEQQWRETIKAMNVRELIDLFIFYVIGDRF